GYHDAVHAQTLSALRSLTAKDLERIVDERWDPPVSLGVRLVSALSDDLQHVGQAAYVRGLPPPTEAWPGSTTSRRSALRSSKGRKALLTAFTVTVRRSSAVQPASSTSRDISRVIVVPDTSRLSVLTVTRKPRSFSAVTGCPAIEVAAPVWRLEVGHISSAIRRSRTQAARRPSLPSARSGMSSVMRTPCPMRCAPHTW